MGWQTGDQSQLFYLFNLERAHSGGPSVAPDPDGGADTG
jgi:hypothetical protein